MTQNEGLCDWQPIDTAPRDGRPVWARGDNWGHQEKGQHCCWAWHDGANWKSADSDEDGQTTLAYLREWLPRASA